MGEKFLKSEQKKNIYFNESGSNPNTKLSGVLLN